MSHRHLVTPSLKKTIKHLTSLFILLILLSQTAHSQVAINTTGADPDASAILDITSTDKGVLIPRITTAERIAITTPANGLMVYDTETKSFWYYNNDDTEWVEVTSGILELNDLSDAKNEGYSLFLGTDAGQNDDGTNNYNTCVGNSSAINNTSGSHNSFFGMLSGYENTTGHYNSFFGYVSGKKNTTGQDNAGFGRSTLLNNSTGNSNTAIGNFAGIGESGNSFSGCVMLGYSAGRNNTSDNKLYIDNSDTINPLIGGDFSTDQVDINGTIKITGGTPGVGKVLTSDADGLASWEDNPGATVLNDLGDAITDGNSVFIGTNSGTSNTGDKNTAMGYNSIKFNTTGSNNTAFGYQSLISNTSGGANTALGLVSMEFNTTGGQNTAIGSNVLRFNTTGNDNVAIGFGTLLRNTTGNNNTAIGNGAAQGYTDSSFSGCIMLGYRAGYNNTSDNKLYIENSDSNTPLIGGDFDSDQVDINGTIKITGGTPGNGKVLTSDIDGLASWEDNPGATELDDLSDASTPGQSLFIGQSSGVFSSGINNTAIGYNAMKYITTGEYNTVLGTSSLREATTGTWNTIIGSCSASMSNGDYNVSLGANNLLSDTAGSSNVAIGVNVLTHNTTGSYNIAIGRLSLLENHTGSNNTAIGYQAGYGVSGNDFSGCVFLGSTAGKNNTSDNKLYIENSDSDTPLIGGDFSTDQVDINGTIKITGGIPGVGKVLTSDADGLASWQTPATYATDINDLSDAEYNGSDLFLGNGAGTNNSGSNSGVALGKNALNANTTSDFNTAIGYGSLDITTGERNTAVGSNSLGANTSGDRNTCIGYSSGVYNVSGSYNTFIGYRTQMNSTVAKDNSTAIGSNAVITASNQVRIGNADVTSIGGVVPWSTVSDGRFKDNIKEDVAGLDFVLNLRPVSYTVNKQAFKNFVGDEYKSNNKTTTQRECGFVAQEVEELIQKTGVEFNGVDAPENGDDYYGIRYSQFVVPLVVGMQEQQQQIENMKKENTNQTTEIENLKEENDALKARLEKLEEMILKK